MVAANLHGRVDLGLPTARAEDHHVVAVLEQVFQTWPKRIVVLRYVHRRLHPLSEDCSRLRRRQMLKNVELLGLRVPKT
jgi:hypothetical protein